MLFWHNWKETLGHSTQRPMFPPFYGCHFMYVLHISFISIFSVQWCSPQGIFWLPTAGLWPLIFGLAHRFHSLGASWPLNFTLFLLCSTELAPRISVLATKFIFLGASLRQSQNPKNMPWLYLNKHTQRNEPGAYLPALKCRMSRCSSIRFPSESSKLHNPCHLSWSGFLDGPSLPVY